MSIIRIETVKKAEISKIMPQKYEYEEYKTIIYILGIKIYSKWYKLNQPKDKIIATSEGVPLEYQQKTKC